MRPAKLGEGKGPPSSQPELLIVTGSWNKERVNTNNTCPTMPSLISAIFGLETLRAEGCIQINTCNRVFFPPIFLIFLPLVYVIIEICLLLSSKNSSVFFSLKDFAAPEFPCYGPSSDCHEYFPETMSNISCSACPCKWQVYLLVPSWISLTFPSWNILII